MKKLTLAPSIQDGELNFFEQQIGEKLPNDFANFIKEYAGLSTIERVYIDEKGDSWIISDFIPFNDMLGLTKEFINAGFGKMVAFGYDPGGWHFCLCLEKINYNSIYIYRWSDDFEPRFLEISKSFEKFIDNLKREDEV